MVVMSPWERIALFTALLYAVVSTEKEIPSPLHRRWYAKCITSNLKPQSLETLSCPMSPTQAHTMLRSIGDSRLINSLILNGGWVQGTQVGEEQDFPLPMIPCSGAVLQHADPPAGERHCTDLTLCPLSVERRWSYLPLHTMEIIGLLSKLCPDTLCSLATTRAICCWMRCLWYE